MSWFLDHFGVGASSSLGTTPVIACGPSLICLDCGVGFVAGKYIRGRPANGSYLEPPKRCCRCCQMHLVVLERRVIDLQRLIQSDTKALERAVENARALLPLISAGYAEAMTAFRETLGAVSQLERFIRRGEEEVAAARDAVTVAI